MPIASGYCSSKQPPSKVHAVEREQRHTALAAEDRNFGRVGCSARPVLLTLQEGRLVRPFVVLLRRLAGALVS